MTKLYSWVAKRAGGRITIYHSAGKIPHIDTIEVLTLPDEAPQVVALASDGKRYILVVAPKLA